MAANQRAGDEKRSPAQPLAVGCLMAIPGFFGGGMIAVGIGKIVDGFSRCQPADGLPICNMLFLPVGAVAGAILLPSAVMWLMVRRKGGRTMGNSDRS